MAAIWAGIEVYAVGTSGTILHSHNGEWKTEVNADRSDLIGVWGRGQEVYAIGANVILRRVYLPGAQLPKK